MTNNRSILIWDGEGLPSQVKSEQVFLWSGYNNESGFFSIPRYLDERGPLFRERYIRFIHELGLQKIENKSVIRHLEVDDGFSFWWMGHLAEKSPFKSPRLFDCLRLLALEEILKKDPAKYLTLHSNDKLCIQAVHALCINLGIQFTLVSIGRKKVKFNLRSVYQILPWHLKGLLSLRHVIGRWSLRTLADPRWFSGDKSLLFVSYFFNINIVRAKNSNFHSHQWEEFPRRLQETGYELNWLHHMLLTPEIEDVATGLGMAQIFNKNSRKEGCHSFVESQLSISLLLGALLDWVRFGRIASYLWPRLTLIPYGSVVDLRPLLQEDWFNSTIGPIAICNCLWRRLFNKALAKIPHQPKGLYLWENQGWESAFIHAWRKFGHGQIIGVPHATIAFWHTNNYDDKRLQRLSCVETKPQPDYLAVNGPIALQMFIEAGYPKERLVPVEALRFQYLDKIDPKKSSEKTEMLVGKIESIKILLLGDISEQQTLDMIACMADAIAHVSKNLSITFKSHPASSIRQEEIRRLGWNYTECHLSEVINGFSMVFASNSSSAGVDALLAGTSVAIFLYSKSLNHSPLRQIPGVQFVSNSQELANYIEMGAPCELISKDKFFWFGENLTRWFILIEQKENRAG